MIIVAKKQMKWRGYGFTLRAGANEVDFDALPYGLQRSLQRHAKYNHIKLLTDEEAANEIPEADANQSDRDAGGEGAGSDSPSETEQAEAQAETGQEYTIGDLLTDTSDESPVSVETVVSETPKPPTVQPKRRKRRR